MSRLELAIAWRYLRSRRGSRLLSFISLIAIGGVVVGVSALIIVMGVMNGLQADLREKILVGSPDVRVLNLGVDLKIDDWRRVLEKTKRSFRSKELGALRELLLEATSQMPPGQASRPADSAHMGH